jgi:hypothetical protein
MTICKDKTTGLYRFQFQFRTIRHSSKWFETRKEARDAEAEKRKELKAPPAALPQPEPEQTAITFADLTDDFLNYAEGYNVRRVYLNKKATTGKIRRLTKWGIRPANEITRDMLLPRLMNGEIAV